ncbi:hypothetical protein BGX34_007301, partial [Mortierella sp. NVP85]
PARSFNLESPLATGSRYGYESTLDTWYQIRKCKVQRSPGVPGYHLKAWNSVVVCDSLCLLWTYSLDGEDGLGASIEEPGLKVCTSDDSANAVKDADIKEADLVDEDIVGRLVDHSRDKSHLLRDCRHDGAQMDIYPVLVLRSLVLVAHRTEHYIARIMETGDKVQRTEDIEIVRATNYDPSTSNEEPFHRKPSTSR